MVLVWNKKQQGVKVATVVKKQQTVKETAVVKKQQKYIPAAVTTAREEEEGEGELSVIEELSEEYIETKKFDFVAVETEPEFQKISLQ